MESNEELDLPGPMPPTGADAQRSRVIRGLHRYWIPILGVIIVIWLIVIAYPNEAYLHTDASTCMRDSLSLFTDYSGCQDNLRAAIWSAAAPGPSSPSFFTRNMPAFLMWADNLFVDLYTLFFIAAAALAYKKLTSIKSDPIFLWRAAITATCILALMGAVADHAENFWILSYLEPDPSSVMPPYDGQLPHIAKLSAIKFRLFFINLAVAALWWVRVLCRYRWERKRYELLRSLLDDEKPIRLREFLGLAKDDDHHWPEEMSLSSLIIPETSTQVWLGIFFFHFLRERKGEPRFRYSFSVHAIRRWKDKLALVPRDAERAPMYSDELDRFLNVLANNGYLTPKGVRFEVTWSTFKARIPRRDEGIEVEPSPKGNGQEDTKG
jgi:hypothetical protein